MSRQSRFEVRWWNLFGEVAPDNPFSAWHWLWRRRWFLMAEEGLAQYEQDSYSLGPPEGGTNE